MGKSLAQLNVVIGAQVKGFEKSLNKVQKQLRKFERNLEKTGRSLTQNLTLPMAALGGGAVKVAADMETLEASLVTAFRGSETAAKQALKQITKFTAETPFQLQEVTEGFIKLKNMGLNPSMEALTSYGNTASSMGKSLNQMVEAVADAAVGEFERLKEFGIKARSEGDKVAFTFRGVTTTVQKNSAEIQKYLLDIGNTEFAGGIERQANTINGKMSTLRDNITLALAELGKEIVNAFDLKEVITNLTTYIGNLTRYFSSLDEQTKKNIIRKAAFAAAIGPAILAIAKLVSVIQGSIGMMKNLIVLALNPVALSLAALGAAALYVWANWEAFSSRFQNMWTAVKNKVTTSIKFILSKLEQLQQFLGVQVFDLSEAFADEKLEAADMIDEPSFKSIGDTIDTLKGKFKDLLKIPTTPLATDNDLGGSDFAIETPSTTGGALAPISKEIKDLPELTAQSFKLVSENISSLDEVMKEKGQSMNTTFAELKSGIIDNVTEIGGIISSGLSESFGAFSDSLAGLVDGTASMGNAARAFMLPLVGILEQVGEAAIKTGVGMIAIKQALEFKNPFAAIAAGIAMKALAGAVKSKISAAIPALAEGGLAFGPTLALVGDNKGASADPEVIAPLSKLSGMLQDVMKPMAYNMQPVSYGSGLAVEFGEIKLKGSDMYAAWKIQQKREGRIK